MRARRRCLVQARMDASVRLPGARVGEPGHTEAQPLCGRAPAQRRIRHMPAGLSASSRRSSLAVRGSEDSVCVLGGDRPGERFGQLQQLQGRLRVAHLLLDRVQKRQLGRPPGGVDFSCTSHLQPFVWARVRAMPTARRASIPAWILERTMDPNPRSSAWDADGRRANPIDIEPHGQMYRSAGGPVISIWWAAAISSSSASDTLACSSATLSLSK